MNKIGTATVEHVCVCVYG